MRTEIPRSAAFFAAGGFVAATFLIGAAHAITESAFSYSTPQIGYLHIPNSAFVPQNSDTAYSNGEFAVIPVGGTETCLLAPVNLPQGAVMSVLSVWYRKATGTLFTVTLSRKKMTNLAFDRPVDFQDLPDNATYGMVNLNVNPKLRTIENHDHSYLVQVCMYDNADAFYGARIRYTYTTAGS